MENELIKILAYGDSNTWGEIPLSGEQHSENDIWTYQLQKMLGDNYLVINEGLPGRTATDISNISKKLERDYAQNGFIHFARILESHLPLQLLIIFLGTNDLKNRFNRTSSEISKGIEALIKEARRICLEQNIDFPEIIILSPPIVKESKVKPPYQMEGAEKRSREFFKYYSQVAKRNNCLIIDLSKFLESSDLDGMHLDREAHQQIAEHLSELILILNLEP